MSNFLVSNALYWLEEFHMDGLRVDAVASMLYRDYSREAGKWVPNKAGGRENYEAIAVLQRMNTVAYGEVAGVMTVAEEMCIRDSLRTMRSGLTAQNISVRIARLVRVVSRMAIHPCLMSHS